MAQRTEGTAAPRAGFFSRNLEYLLLLVIAAIGAAGLVLWNSNDDKSTSGAPSATQAQVPTCAQAHISPQTGREGTCRTATAQITVVNSEHPLELPGVTVRALSADGFTATTPSGRQRQRLRAAVRLQLTNTGATTLRRRGADAPIYLNAAGGRAVPDPREQTLPGALDLSRPLARGQHRTGMVLFELAGAQTRSFRRGSATLGVRASGLTADARRDGVGAIRIKVDKVQPAKPG